MRAHPGDDGFHRAVRVTALNGTAAFRQSDEIVTALGEKACADLAVDERDGIGTLVAVMPGILHPDDGRHVYIDAAYALEQIAHLIALESERGFIAHVLRRAAAAA